MARARRRSADASDIANSLDPLDDELLRDISSPVVPSSVVLSRLDEFVGPSIPFDRRLFSFGAEADRFRITSGAVQDPRRSLSQDRVAFATPDTVGICVRRKERREVLFAKRRFGGSGRRRRTWRSDIKC